MTGVVINNVNTFGQAVMFWFNLGYSFLTMPITIYNYTFNFMMIFYFGWFVWILRAFYTYLTGGQVFPVAQTLYALNKKHDVRPADATKVSPSITKSFRR